MSVRYNCSEMREQTQDVNGLKVEETDEGYEQIHENKEVTNLIKEEVKEEPSVIYGDLKDIDGSFAEDEAHHIKSDVMDEGTVHEELEDPFGRKNNHKKITMKRKIDVIHENIPEPSASEPETNNNKKKKKTENDEMMSEPQTTEPKKRKNIKINKPPSIRRSLTCDKCSAQFPTKWKLNRHSRVHMDKEHECPQCGKKYSEMEGLLKHQVIHEQGKQFECPECKKLYTDEMGLKRHIKSHTEVKPFDCNECGIGFMHKSALATHMKIHLGQKAHKCPRCPLRFARKFDLERHLKAHLDEPTLTCDQCGKQFRRKYDFDAHYRNHTGDKPFECSTCRQQFATLSNLNEHKKSHVTAEDGEKSSKKKKVSSSVDLLQEDNNMENRVQGSTAAVDSLRLPLTESYVRKCGNMNSPLLERDENVKVNDASGVEAPTKFLQIQFGESLGNDFDSLLPCDMCGKLFKAKANLEKHLRIHLNVRPYKCEAKDCGKDFVQKAHLTKHKKIHERDLDVNKFPCFLCAEKFPEKKAVKAHFAKEHEGVKLYECHHCEKLLKDQKSLTRHARTHTLPFPCFLCEKKFAQKELLKKHKMNHHPSDLDVNKFPCVLCAEKFQEKKAMKKAHFAKEHEGVELYECHQCEKLLKDQKSLTKNTTSVKCNGCGDLCHLKRCSNLVSHLDWTSSYKVPCCAKTSSPLPDSKQVLDRPLRFFPKNSENPEFALYEKEYDLKNAKVILHRIDSNPRPTASIPSNGACKEELIIKEEVASDVSPDVTNYDSFSNESFVLDGMCLMKTESLEKNDGGNITIGSSKKESLETNDENSREVTQIESKCNTSLLLAEGTVFMGGGTETPAYAKQNCCERGMIIKSNLSEDCETVVFISISSD